MSDGAHDSPARGTTSRGAEQHVVEPYVSPEYTHFIENLAEQPIGEQLAAILPPRPPSGFPQGVVSNSRLWDLINTVVSGATRRPVDMRPKAEAQESDGGEGFPDGVEGSPDGGEGSPDGGEGAVGSSDGSDSGTALGSAVAPERSAGLDPAAPPSDPLVRRLVAAVNEMTAGEGKGD